MSALIWKPPTYPGDRQLGMCGGIAIGAVFAPLSGKYWRWRSWIGVHSNPTDGSEKTEALAKAAVERRFQQFLDAAELQPALAPPNLQAAAKQALDALDDPRLSTHDHDSMEMIEKRETAAEALRAAITKAGG